MMKGRLATHDFECNCNYGLRCKNLRVNEPAGRVYNMQNLKFV